MIRGYFYTEMHYINLRFTYLLNLRCDTAQHNIGNFLVSSMSQLMRSSSSYISFSVCQSVVRAIPIVAREMSNLKICL